ncbi:MAG: vWA domain-containing protein [Candidatus Methylomirabilales bacterium]
MDAIRKTVILLGSPPSLRLALAMLVAVGSFLTALPAAFAAPGDRLGTVNLVGIGSQSVSITFDGTYYIVPLSGSGWASDTLSIYQPPASGAGDATLVATKSLPVRIGAVAWDPNRGKVWGAYDSKVWLIDVGDPTVSGDATATLQFNSNVAGQVVDGLAYDGSNDTLYYSPDQSCCVYHFSLGTEFNPANPPLGELIDLVEPKNADGIADGNVSGVVVGSGNTLYIGRPGGNEIRRVDKSTGAFISQFAALSASAWVEDLTCDPITYSPKEAIVVKYLKPLYEAFEVDPGTCPLQKVEETGSLFGRLRVGALTVEAMGEGVAEMLTPLQIELILDASGSMREQKRKVDGRLKIDVAKEVMVQSIESLPNGIEVALRVYGHRIREGQKGDCQDSELVFPFAKIDKPRLIQRVRQIQALGTTPIAYSLQQVAQDFGNAPGEKMVILVTDGKEECGGNPSAAVAELLAKGLKVRVNVVGFALAEEAVKQEMNRVAKLTGGRFFDAKDAKGLRKAIQESLGVPYDVLDPAGTKVGSGLTGQTPIEVPDGIYTVVVAVAGKPVSIPNVRITEKKSTRVELKREGQEIVSKVVGP